jgi:hypothetical protein
VVVVAGVGWWLMSVPQPPHQRRYLLAALSNLRTTEIAKRCAIVNIMIHQLLVYNYLLLVVEKPHFWWGA